MTRRIRQAVTLVAMMLVLTVLGLGLQGCTRDSVQTGSGAKSETKKLDIQDRKGNAEKKKSFNKAREALKIKPTMETRGLYNAVKDADRVAISVVADIFDDRCNETVLGSFDVQDPVFWDLMRAVTSANKYGSV